MTVVAGFQIGEVIAGKYRIERILGAGGMGVVIAARHLSLDDVVAIKFLSLELANDTNAVSRFDREARAAAKIKSEHVARVFDVDRLPNGVPYMVMEYMQGADLSALLDEQRPLPPELAVTFLLHACAGLGEAHRAGIVHRDIKPSNLFCVGRWDRVFTIKVLDFGISKLTLTSDSMQPKITGTGAAIGSPAYMSPEQMRSSAEVDARTDIWSLGVVLYELLTGRLPFNGASFPELCLKIAGEPPVSPRLHRPDLSPRLEAAILKCLEKDREHRFATVAELAEALLPLAPAAVHLVERIRLTAAQEPGSSLASTRAEQVSTLPLAVPASFKNPTTDATWTNTELRSEPPKPRKFRGIAAGAGLGLAVSLAGAWWLRSPAEPSVRTAPTPVSAKATAPEPAITNALPSVSLSGASAASSPAPSPSPSLGAPRPSSVQPPSSSKPSLAAPPISAPPQRSKNAVWGQRD